MPRKSSVLVLGAGVGGLSAALHARLLGHDVLVLEGRDRSGGKAAGLSEPGYSLDPGPSIIILTRIYEAVFRAAGRKMEDYLRFRRLDPISRVFFEGDPPLDLPGTVEACTEVVRQIEPSDAASFQDLMERIGQVAGAIDRSIFRRPYDHPLSLLDPNLMKVGLKFGRFGRYKDEIDRRFRSPLLRAFFYGFPSYGGQSYDSKAPGALMIPYLMLTEGVWYPEGGVAAIPAALERLAVELGVQIRHQALVDRLETSPDKVTYVALHSGERFEAEGVISNIDRLTVEQLLGRAVDVKPSFSYLTVHLGLPREIPGMEHHTLFIPRDFDRGFEQLYGDRAYPTSPIVYANLTSATDPSTAPAGRSNLFLVATSPAMGEAHDWDVEGEGLARRLEAQVERYGFDLSNPDFRRVQTPATFNKRDGNYLGSLYGPDEPQRHFGGLLPLPSRHPKLRNLFFAGGSVQPGAGLPMVTLSGRFAAEALNRHLQRA